MNVSQNHAVAFENLEGRQMLASHHAVPYHASAHHAAAVVAPKTVTPVKPATPAVVATPVTVTANGSTLTITGTTGNDQIVVKQAGNVFAVANGTWSTTVTGTFTQIVAKGNGGNDAITMDKTVTVPCTFYGAAGNDTLTGSNAADTFYAGAGTNVMVGNGGDDTFVTIGSTGDTLTGGDGNDTFWMDNSKTESVIDLSAAEKAAGHQHLVSTFLNGASTALTGGAIADPSLTNNTMVYKNFSTNPLFSATGPSENDINQGYLGDCYFLSALSATAKVSPDRIRQSIVSLGDGTYAVQMKQANGVVGFVRIDADLAVWGANGPIAYANTGAGNSVWVALLEKAFTYFRSGANPKAAAFNTIDNGGWMSESFNALGLANSDIYGRSATDLANQVNTALKAGKAVTLGIGNVPAGAPLIGDHAYTVDHVNVDANGAIVSVTLRNPWGVDGAGNDGKNDGYVTVTVAQLYAASMGGNAAIV